jgi:hypothetical protein
MTRFLLLSTLLLSTPALAETDGTFDRPMQPVRNALEIAIGGGYTGAYGATGVGVDAQDVAGPGGHAELQLAYRISPRFSIGVRGTLENYANGDMLSGGNDVAGASIGLVSTYHLRPTRSVDPWISMGGGTRWLELDDRNGNTSTLRGFDLARLQVGVDYRLAKNVAITPYIGGTATLYTDHDTSMTNGYREIDSKEVSWTFSGGLLGRFDIGM